MRTICSREIFTKKCRQRLIYDSDLKGAWHYNHVTFTPTAKNFMLYCRLIYTLSILYVRLTLKVKVGIPESFKVGWYPPKKTGSSHLKRHQTRARRDRCARTPPSRAENLLGTGNNNRLCSRFFASSRTCAGSDYVHH